MRNSITRLGKARSGRYHGSVTSNWRRRTSPPRERACRYDLGSGLCNGCTRFKFPQFGVEPVWQIASPARVGACHRTLLSGRHRTARHHIGCHVWRPDCRPLGVEWADICGRAHGLDNRRRGPAFTPGTCGH